uniref:Putative cytochrome n=1 Tax=Corethrella appendiculata TaxID=1370023 RepID=U5EWR7_9DIPT
MFIFILLPLLITLCYLYFYAKFSFWRDFEVPYCVPRFLVPKYADIQSAYNEAKREETVIAGTFRVTRPIVIAVHLDVVNQILVKDFQNFQSRSYHQYSNSEALSLLHQAGGDKWQNLRSRLSSILSSEKMKIIVPTIFHTGDGFNKQLSTLVGERGKIIDITNITKRLTVDIIGDCLFGSKDEFKNEFNKMVIKYSLPEKEIIGSGGYLSRVTMLKENIAKKFTKLVNETINYKESCTNSHNGNDFMDFMLELKKEGNLSETEAISQAFCFAVAGFKSIAYTLSYCLYELAMNSELQKQARVSVKEAILKHNGYTYESILDMKYLDQCIKETLRKYPVVPATSRLVTSDFYCILKRGMQVLIPTHSIHHDPEYYPKPEIFDPSRFTDEEIAKRPPCSFIPFGDGPRNCLGNKLAMFQLRIALTSLLLNFTFHKCEQTAEKLLQAKSIGSSLKPEKSIYLKMVKL